MLLSDNSSNQAARRKVEVEDLYRYRLVSDPQASPDGRLVAYTQTRLRKKKNDYASNIWLVASDGSTEPIKFTGSDKRDMSPKWSSNGREIAFLSTRSGKPQIWVIPVGGGEARQLTRIKRGVGEFEWSPDGRWIAFTSKVDNEEDKKATSKAKSESEGNREEDSENREPSGRSGEEGFGPLMPAAGEWDDDEDEEKDEEDKGDHARVITRLFYKGDGQGFFERRSHLFLVPSKGGQPKQVTEGDWDAGAPRWSPDGKTLAFISNQEQDADYTSIRDIFALSIGEDGQAGEMRRVSNHDISIWGMDWLPSGDGFASYAHRRTNEGALATHLQVWTLPLDGGEARSLTEGLDRSVGTWLNSDLRSGSGELRPRFSKDGGLIYFHLMNGGAIQVYSVPISGGEPRQVIGGERQIINFDVTSDSVVFAATTATNPNDLYRADLDGGNERQLTDANRDILDQIQVQEPVEFWVDTQDGERVQGWVLMPHGYEQGKKYPFVLQIHGGPHTSYGGAYIHEFQLLASRGYAVMYTNPRGSQGYGQVFSDAILNDWGGVDYEDILSCVNYAIGQGYVDEERMGVAGGSYGGYMVTWIIGHSQQFRAAVASRMVSNLYSAWGSGDFTWMLWNWEFQGTPQERTALYLERSPVTYVSEIRTPLLITHALDDLRTAFEQADQMYTALKVLRREVKMVTFPSGGHEISRSGKPSLRVERIQHIVDWFDQHLMTDENVKRET